VTTPPGCASFATPEPGSGRPRPDFQRLLIDVKERRFKFILIFDVARFSRSLGVLWDTIFGRLKRRGVVVIDVSTNTRSDSPNAKMVFGIMGGAGPDPSLWKRKRGCLSAAPS
jgi:DNA invertase Pin-like site-specific DNA recombinase